MAILSALVAACLAIIELRAVGRNIGTPYNGYGALRGALFGCTTAPMSTRVLLAPLGALPERYRLGAYLAAKWALCWWALALYSGLAGPMSMLVLAVLIATTYQFDYWDGYAELVGVLLCLTGQPGAVVLGAAVWGASRETVLLAPLLAWPWGLVGPAVLLAIVACRGFPPPYCKRWHLRDVNVPDLVQALQRRDVGMGLSVLWTVAVVIMVLSGRSLPPPLGRTTWAPLAWIVAGWTLGRARETRIFMPVALWLPPAIV